MSEALKSRKIWLIVIPAIITALSLELLYLVLIPNIAAVKENYFSQHAAELALRQIPLYTHIIFGGTALITGAINVYLGLKKRTHQVHKLIGGTYATSVTIAAIAGIVLAPFSYGGLLAHIGFLTLAMLWLGTLAMALWAIIVKHQTRKHRNWMILNFSLTFAAVTLRIQIAPFIGVSDDLFYTAYSIIAWTCWVPNLIYAHYLASK